LQILLVPTTECLLTGKDRETGFTYTDLAMSDEFLASHVLRISGTPTPGNGSVRDHRGKAKQLNTMNGKTVVVKESFVYSNKGKSTAFTARRKAVSKMLLRFSESQPGATAD